MRIHLVGSDPDVVPESGRPGWSGRGLQVSGLAEQLATDGHDVTVVGSRVAQDDSEPPFRHVHADPESLRDTLDSLSSTGAPDVVHALDSTAGLTAADSATTSGAVLVQSLASVTGTTAQDVLLRRADRVLADSESQVDDLLRRGTPRSRIRVVPPGVDTDSWTPDGESLRRGDGARVVFVGSLVPSGGADDAIAAMRYVPDAELYIAGGPAAGVTKDPDLLRLQEIAARAGVSRRVRFLGTVGQDNVRRLLRSADVVVCPSHRGGSGSSALEAMACGRTVVATGVGCQRDIVVDGVTGRHVRPSQPIELGTTVRMVLADPTTCQAYGIAGRDRATARYSRPRIARAVTAAYEEAVLQLHPVVEVEAEAVAAPEPVTAPEPTTEPEPVTA